MRSDNFLNMSEISFKNASRTQTNQTNQTKLANKSSTYVSCRWIAHRRWPSWCCPMRASLCRLCRSHPERPSLGPTCSPSSTCSKEKHGANTGYNDVCVWARYTKYVRQHDQYERRILYSPDYSFCCLYMMTLSTYKYSRWLMYNTISNWGRLSWIGHGARSTARMQLV